MYYIWCLCIYIKEILTSPEVKGKKKEMETHVQAYMAYRRL